MSIKMRLNLLHTHHCPHTFSSSLYFMRRPEQCTRGYTKSSTRQNIYIKSEARNLENSGKNRGRVYEVELDFGRERERETKKEREKEGETYVYIFER